MSIRSDYDALKLEFEELTESYQQIKTEYAEQMRRANRLLGDARQKQQAAAAAHHESQQQLTDILVNMPASAIIVDAKTHSVVMVNPAFCTGAGSDKPAESMSNTPLAELMIPCGKAVQKPKGQREQEFKLLATEAHIKCVSWPMQYQMKKCYLYLIISPLGESDTSPQASLKSVAASAAHEFNNLLMGIYGNASLIHYDMDPGHTHFESLENILRYVQNGTRLTDQLLRIQDGSPREALPEDPEAFRKTLEMLKADRNKNGVKEVPLTQHTIKKPGTVARAYEQISKINRTILLVDDEIMILDVGKKILKKMGAAVLTAQNGHEALEVFSQFRDKIDLVILDMIMPGMDGEETCRLIRQSNPEVKVLLASGYTPKPQASRIISQEGTDFIQKPFNMIQISKKIKALLDE